MARITNPLHSVMASGSVGRAVTFTKTARGAVAKRYSKPTGTPAAAQLAQRAAYAATCAAWNALSPEQKQTWDAAGKARKISGFNAYLSENINAGPAPHVPSMRLIDAPVGADFTEFLDCTADGAMMLYYSQTLGIVTYGRWTQTGGYAELAIPQGWGAATARRMSADGSVVVGNAIAAPTNTGCIWIGQAEAVSLGTIPGEIWSSATAVSDAGDVVCGATYSATDARLTIWTQQSGLVAIDNPVGATACNPLAMSGDGSTVVGSIIVAGVQRAFRWTLAGGYELLGEIVNGNWYQADAVSYDGSIVAGEADDADNYWPCTWDAAGNCTTLDLLQGELYGWATTISASGATIAGVMDTNNGYRATMWNAAGQETDMGLMPGGGNSQANCMSDNGLIIAGTANDQTSQRGMIYD